MIWLQVSLVWGPVWVSPWKAEATPCVMFRVGGIADAMYSWYTSVAASIYAEVPPHHAKLVHI